MFGFLLVDGVDSLSIWCKKGQTVAVIAFQPSQFHDAKLERNRANLNLSRSNLRRAQWMSSESNFLIFRPESQIDFDNKYLPAQFSLGSAEIPLVHALRVIRSAGLLLIKSVILYKADGSFWDISKDISLSAEQAKQTLSPKYINRFITSTHNIENSTASGSLDILAIIKALASRASTLVSATKLFNMAPITKILSVLSSASLINAIVIPESITDFPVVHDAYSSIYDAHSALPSVFNLTLSGKTHPTTKSSSDEDETPLPLIIWHGLGDNYKADGLAQVGKLAEAIHPGTLVYNIHVGDDASADRTATFFGNITRESTLIHSPLHLNPKNPPLTIPPVQIEKVCSDLASHPILSTAPAVDAIGFSQGGQFLRGYISRCNSPPIRSLLTFGSQHNGISSFQACTPTDFLCRGAQSLLRSNTWSPFVQSRLVPAQYFRDPKDLDSYLEHSNFLADINNERTIKNQAYKSNMEKLERFVMYVFEDDTTVIPKETGWWSEVNGTEITPLKERAIYKEDWVGLKTLDEAGKLRFETIPGGHMTLGEEMLEKAFREYFGPAGKEFEETEYEEGTGHEEEL
ncbi:hypothetical protein DSL72_002353 [Monilinia vaccinii-corymbosi]|uniref:palmitoyl-protein hydrolase n=1 Tax=Monilinia vaccinii-corymbosi TaxID=61207 RepID=A0A8A3PCD5_9HELO|nr:hypothetical protein DSL72_002353 [Monilinia vaccinii-corymbosi]